MDNSEKDRFLSLAFQSFLETSNDMIFIKDRNLVYVAASRPFAVLVGLSRGADLVGKTDFDIFDPELAKKYTEDDYKILTSGIYIKDYIEPLPDKDGKKSYSSTSKYLIRNDDGQIIGVYGVSRDVTTQVELEAECESSHFSRQMFDSVLEADISEDKMLRMEGTDWVQEMGIWDNESFSETVQELAKQFVHPDYIEGFIANYDKEKLITDYANGRQDFTHTIYMYMSDGSLRWVEFSSRVYHSRISNTLRITTFLKDVDNEVRHQQSLQTKANTDALTGLRNRENMMENIEARITENGSEKTCALLFIDLDYFKQVNDHWGHQFGDCVLKQTAERMQQFMREDDLCGRVGGDEFLIFLKQVTSRQQVEQIAQRAVDSLVFHLVKDDIDVHVTCSVGIALCKNDGLTSVSSLYEQADRAMYRAKESGRNRYCFYDDM